MLIQGILRQAQPDFPSPSWDEKQSRILAEPGVVGMELVRASLFCPQSGEVLVNVKEHSRQINDIQLSRDMTMFVTASKDNTAKVSLGKGCGGPAPTL